MAACLPIAAVAQAVPQPAPSPVQTSPASQPSPAAPPSEAGLDLSKLTPAQQAALQEAIIKTSQNPVGNIAIVPFQNNFNYGVGPYTRFQYNLNIQPVVPFMLSKDMTLIARTIIPVINQPSFAPPPVCASQYGCGSTFGLGDIQEQLFFAPKTKPGDLIWASDRFFKSPARHLACLGPVSGPLGQTSSA